jgi:hypothetical protein
LSELVACIGRNNWTYQADALWLMLDSAVFANDSQTVKQFFQPWRQEDGLKYDPENEHHKEAIEDISKNLKGFSREDLKFICDGMERLGVPRANMLFCNEYLEPNQINASVLPTHSESENVEHNGAQTGDQGGDEEGFIERRLIGPVVNWLFRNVDFD